MKINFRFIIVLLLAANALFFSAYVLLDHVFPLLVYREAEAEFYELSVECHIAKAFHNRTLLLPIAVDDNTYSQLRKASEVHLYACDSLHAVTQQLLARGVNPSKLSAIIAASRFDVRVPSNRMPDEVMGDA